MLKDPSAVANHVVVPDGLYVLSKNAQRNPDGTATAMAQQVNFYIRGKTLAVIEPKVDEHKVRELPKPVVIDPELARRLSDMKAVHLLPVMPGPAGVFTHDFGDTAAVLTFHVQKRTGGEGTEWVPVLKQAEYLVAMNFWRVGEKKFKDSFRTLTVHAHEPPHLGLSTRSDWSARLNASYLMEVRHFIRNIKDGKFAAEMQQMSSVLGQAMNNVIRNNVDPARVMDQQLRNRTLGR
jgi:hypothetical protein